MINFLWTPFIVLPQIIMGLLLAVAVAVIQDWDNFKAGLSGCPERIKV